MVAYFGRWRCGSRRPERGIAAGQKRVVVEHADVRMVGRERRNGGVRVTHLGGGGVRQGGMMIAVIAPADVIRVAVVAEVVRRRVGRRHQLGQRGHVVVVVVLVVRRIVVAHELHRRCDRGDRR